MTTWMRSAQTLVEERLGLIALTLFAATAVLVGVIVVDGAGARDGVAGRDDGKKTIARMTSNGLRVTLVAQHDPSQDPPLATIRIAAFERSAGEWDRLGRPRIVSGRSAWFWRVVTRRFGVRELAVRMPGGPFPVRVQVRLLASPSLGASAPFRFVVDGGRLVPVDV
jgi:hypothetical protein